MISKLFYRNLSVGCEGSDVQALQILLVGFGFKWASGGELLPELTIGKFGKVTDGTLKALQVKMGAVPNGIMDPQTLSKLAQYCGVDFSTVFDASTVGS